MRRSGFTIVELLLIIMCLVLIGAILKSALTYITVKTLSSRIGIIIIAVTLLGFTLWRKKENNE